MKTIEWHGESDCALEGIKFHCSLDDYTKKSTSEQFILLKTRDSIEQYADVLADCPKKNILEFGIFQGGSPVLFSLWFDVERFVGIDVADPVPALDRFREAHPIGKRISCYYRTPQSDQDRIEQIVRTEFGNTPLDLIVDDASHLYGHSRQTFEVAFPLLRPGGTYVIEDWGWAHWPGGVPEFAGETPLSVLIMELIMLCASRPDLISEVRVFPGFVYIRKSLRARSTERMQVSNMYLKRGIEIVATQKPNISGLLSFAATRLQQRLSKRLQRTRNKLSRSARRMWRRPGVQ